MNCFYCGAVLTAGTFFCPECGRRVATDEPAAPIEPTAPAPSRPFSLVSTTGQRFEVSGRSILGRNPRPDSEFDDATILVVSDPGKTVSKSHAELRVVAGALFVVDLDSGNGTVIETPGSAPVRCEAGLPHPVARGSRLVLGRQAIDVE